MGRKNEKGHPGLDPEANRIRRREREHLWRKKLQKKAEHGMKFKGWPRRGSVGGKLCSPSAPPRSDRNDDYDDDIPYCIETRRLITINESLPLGSTQC
jgi:hypothetical protein